MYAASLGTFDAVSVDSLSILVHLRYPLPAHLVYSATMCFSGCDCSQLLAPVYRVQIGQVRRTYCAENGHLAENSAQSANRAPASKTHHTDQRSLASAERSTQSLTPIAEAQQRRATRRYRLLQARKNGARPVLKAGRRAVVNRAPRTAGLGPSGFHPWRGPNLRSGKRTRPLRAATVLWPFPEAGGG